MKKHPLYHVLGAEMAAERAEANVTSMVLAESIGVTPSAITHWEKGDNRITVAFFVRYCQEIGVQPGVLLDRLLRSNPALMQEEGR